MQSAICLMHSMFSISWLFPGFGHFHQQSNLRWLWTRIRYRWNCNCRDLNSKSIDFPVFKFASSVRIECASKSRHGRPHWMCTSACAGWGRQGSQRLCTRIVLFSGFSSCMLQLQTVHDNNHVRNIYVQFDCKCLFRNVFTGNGSLLAHACLACVGRWWRLGGDCGKFHCVCGGRLIRTERLHWCLPVGIVTLTACACFWRAGPIKMQRTMYDA